MEMNLKKVIETSIIVILILVVTYFTTAYFLTGELGNGTSKVTTTTKSENATTTVMNTSVSSYNNKIIASKTFDQSGIYYVIFYSEENTDDSIKSAMSSYDTSNSNLKLYKVNIDEAINSYVKSNTANNLPTNSNELKINGTTLLKINDGVVSLYTSSQSDILSELK